MGRTYGEDEINVFNFADTNKDGYLSYNECLAIEVDDNLASFKEYTKSERVNFLFNRYDTDKNGVLDYPEVKELLAQLGLLNPTLNEVNAVIALYDVNRDSKI
jgi:Ca2+-binding EF-hand superfamily protein